ncbi:hypothetical protein Hac_0895 [Helicobacter acinonychis str. Sheeba]|uniref:Uncharacterized protein n=1 Tax=Helicobacter acinonychis (strain Sheeba) TaxID=382638 RepID=Q17XF2_HELAH|nr:hypothetical protein Hac_0895 [Helicobacter acinonychis str. Sheeba]
MFDSISLQQKEPKHFLRITPLKPAIPMGLIGKIRATKVLRCVVQFFFYGSVFNASNTQSVKASLNASTTAE